MKPMFRFRRGDDVRALWCLALGVFIVAVYGSMTKYEPAIASARSATELLYRQTAANERTVRQSSLLHALQNAAESDLRRVSREGSLAATTATFISTLQASARQHRVRITSIQPQAQATPSTVKHDAPEARLLSTGITLRVRGGFREILAFVETLSHYPTLINVSRTHLAVSGGQESKREPLLDATVDATLYRLRPGLQKKEADNAAFGL